LIKQIDAASPATVPSVAPVPVTPAV